jgi:hypothetical protein
MTGKIKKNYTTEFFGRVRGDFNISPQGYHSAWRKQAGARKSFVGPWDYAGITSGGLKSKFVSPQEQPTSRRLESASVQRGGFISPQNHSMGSKSSRGFISPVNDLKITKQKIYKSGANRTQAISEE